MSSDEIVRQKILQGLKQLVRDLKCNLTVVAELGLRELCACEEVVDSALDSPHLNFNFDLTTSVEGVVSISVKTTNPVIEVADNDEDKGQQASKLKLVHSVDDIVPPAALPTTFLTPKPFRVISNTEA